MSTKVTVKDTVITEEKRRVADKNGNFRIDRKQENVYVQLGEERRRMPIELEDGQSAYAPGDYTVDLEAITTISTYGKFQYEPYYKLKLMPVSEKLAVVEKQPLFNK